MTYIHEDCRITCQQIEDLHCKSCIRVSVTCTDKRLFCSVPVIWIIQECCTQTLCTVMCTHFIMTFHTNEIQFILFDNLLCCFVMTNLSFEFLRCKGCSVKFNLTNIVCQPFICFFNLSFINFFCFTNNLKLIDMLYIYAKFFLPVLHGNSCAVHSKASSTDQTIFLSAQSTYNLCTFCKGNDLLKDFFLVNITCYTEVLDSFVIQTAACCKHGNHTRPVRIEWCCKKERSFAISCCDNTEYRESKYAVCKYCGINPFCL